MTRRTLESCVAPRLRRRVWPNSAGASIKLPPDKSVLKLRAGDEIKLTEAEFVRLSSAFFAEIESKFAER